MVHAMSYFNRVALLKAPLVYDVPQPQYVSDLIEICQLAAVVEADVESIKIPVDFYSDTAFDDFNAYLKSETVDLVGISAITGAYNNALKLAEMAKRADKYVVMGGYHPSALPHEALESPFVDAVIIGEGEATFKDFVVNGPSKEVAGMAVKIDGEVVFSGERALVEDLDELPLPLRRIRPERFGEAGDDYTIDTIYTSRGCPMKCSFCANNIVNKRWRGRSPEHIVQELSLLHDPKRKKFIKLWDANFLTDVKRIEALCDLMIDQDLTNFKICFETGVNDIIRVEKIMDKLRRIGVSHVGIGIESPNKTTLKLMNKKIKTDACHKVVQILKDHKIKGQGFFIIGHYSEGVEETKQYPDFARDLDLRNALFMVMTPYPGTQVYDEYKNEDRIKNLNWDLYNNFGTTVETQSMDIKAVKRMHAYCWGKFYVPFAFNNNSTPLGVVANIIQKMAMFYTFFALDNSNSLDEIKNYLFEYLAASSGEQSRARPRKKSLLLRLFKSFDMRFVHSDEKVIDLTIVPVGETLQMRIQQPEVIEAPEGLVIDFCRIITLGKELPTNKLVTIASKMEIIKITDDSRIKLQKKWSLLMDKDVLVTGFQVVRYLVPVLVQGLIQLSVRSIKRK
jgi:magnesium-protoporphyrin IX monomethyl ester (oxidative) cyclase